MKYNKWTFEKLQLEALKYDTRSAFKKGNYGAYQAAIARNLLDQICSHMASSDYFWKDEALDKIIRSYHSRSALAKGNLGAYKVAMKRGLLDDYPHMPKHIDQSGENSPRFKWTHKMLQKEALKYKTKKEFQVGNYAAYTAAQKRGILDEICKHMIPGFKTGENHYNFKWTDKKLRKEALKYTTRAEFQKGSGAAYNAALKRGILDEICSHMKKSSNISIPERELFNIIKNIFISTQKLYDRKVKIDKKPYIKGFEIDIFVPELKLGIEFDGKRYHSFEYMRKDKQKKLWTDCDIVNYHEIKDTWFLTKGIKILHIKEQGWLEDKQACIDRCLEFLSLSNRKAA
jgi:hypothetical protein